MKNAIKRFDRFHMMNKKEFNCCGKLYERVGKNRIVFLGKIKYWFSKNITVYILFLSSFDMLNNNQRQNQKKIRNNSYLPGWKTLEKNCNC